MKVEPQFLVKDNKLIRISDNAEISLATTMRIEAAMICGKELESGARAKMTSEFTATHNKILCVYVPWFLVETEPEIYNEEILASLRDFLKTIEESNLHAIIVPQIESDSCIKHIFDGENFNTEATDMFTAAMKHTARRIKDCASVIGFEIPREILESKCDNTETISNFIDELSQKHSQYIFFARNQFITNDNCKKMFLQPNTLIV